MTRLSVVVPAYNNSHYIAETVRSILEQDFADFELIIADHASTDDTVAVLQQFLADPRVSLHATPAGGGAERNWRAVTERATGEYVKLVCGDDVLLPGALAEHVAALDANPDAALVASRRHILDAAGVPLLRSRGIGPLAGPTAGADAISALVRSGTNLLGEPACVTFRRRALEEAGGWDARDPYLIDEATYAAVLLRGGLVGLPAPAAGFRVNDGQWSVALAAEQSRQARSFHERMRAEHPDIVSRSDVLLGNVRATAMALARRAVYLLYARRLGPPEQSE